MLEHLAVAATAAVVTAGVTPAVARFSRRVGVVDRRVELRPGDTGSSRSAGHPRDGGATTARVPTLGGLAMLVGVLAALALAWQLPAFSALFQTTSEPLAVLVGVLVIVAIGVIDDVRELPPTVKLAGQIVAAIGVVLFGVQLVHFWIPGLEVIALSPDLGLPLTVIALVVMVNAMNLIDGLDGLAAGVAAIAAIAFFLFTVGTGPAGIVDSIPTVATLVAAIVAGIALGFLVHNWHPARIFMGDTGSMLLGLLLGVAGVAYVGRTTGPSSVDFYGTIPLLVPALVLAVPVLDTVFAVVRRLATGQPVAVGDRGHLHHLLLLRGHSHRRAVLVLYYWSAVVAFASIGPAFLTPIRLLPWVLGATAVGILLTVLGNRVPVDDSSAEGNLRRDSA